MWLVNVLSVLISFYLPSSYSVDSKEVSLPNQNQLWMDELNTKMTSGSCIDIPQNLSLCHNVGYKKMAFPNLLGHEELSETIRQSVSWVPLLNVHCNPDTQLFLCSLFSPVCLEYNQTIEPCQSLCENVKAGCEKIMQRYGFEWPEMLKCEKFPANSDLCIPPRPTSGTQFKTCSACRQPKTFEAIIHNYCTSQYAIKGKILSVRNEGGFKVLYLLKKKKIIKAGVLTKKDRKRLKPYLEGMNCECDQIDVGGFYLIMGNKNADGSFTVTYIIRWSKDKSFKRAYKNIRKGFECGQDILDLDKTDNKSKNRIIKGKKEDKVGKGNKSGKNKDKGKRKGKKKRRKNKKKKNKRRKGKKNKKRKNRKKGKRGKKQKNKQKGGNNGMVVPGNMAGNNGNANVNQSSTNGPNKP